MRRESRVFWPFVTWGAALVLLWPAGSVQGAQEPTQAAEPAPVPAKTVAQEMAKTATAGADGKAAVATPTLADLAWLEGQWQGKWGPRVAEQTWMAPKAGIMTGLFRLVEGDKTLVLEMFTVVEKPDGINFYFRHFTPELVAELQSCVHFAPLHIPMALQLIAEAEYATAWASSEWPSTTARTVRMPNKSLIAFRQIARHCRAMMRHG